MKNPFVILTPAKPNERKSDENKDCRVNIADITRYQPITEVSRNGYATGRTVTLIFFNNGNSRSFVETVEEIDELIAKYYGE